MPLNETPTMQNNNSLQKGQWQLCFWFESQLAADMMLFEMTLSSEIFFPSQVQIHISNSMWKTEVILRCSTLNKDSKVLPKLIELIRLVTTP